jgi:hypothetical protein
MTEKGKHLGIHALKIRKPIVDRDLGNDQSEPPREVLVFISEQSETRAAAAPLLAVRRQVLRLHFCRQCFGFRYRARWIHPFGFVASLAFGLVFAYLTIVTGRWLFGRKEL